MQIIKESSLPAIIENFNIAANQFLLNSQDLEKRLKIGMESNNILRNSVAMLFIKKCIKYVSNLYF